MLEITLSLRGFEINDIFNFHQNSRWQPKSCSQDKCVFAFYAEIQDGHQKWRQSDFCEMLPVHSADTLWIKNVIKIALPQTVSKINAFLRSRWWESDFCEKSPVDFAGNLHVQNFVEITLSCTVSEINALLRFMQKFKMATKKWRESDFCKMSPVYSADTLWVQNFVRNCSISHCFQDKCASVLYAEIQDGCKKWWESDFCEKSPVDSACTLWVKNFVKIALSRTVSEINALLHFTQKFKMAVKSVGKAIFVKSRQ